MNSESVGVGRAQTTASRVRDEIEIIREVRMGFAAQRREDQNSQFELVRRGRVAWCPSEVAPLHKYSVYRLCALKR